jgi:hypothetical protein
LPSLSRENGFSKTLCETHDQDLAAMRLVTLLGFAVLARPSPQASATRTVVSVVRMECQNWFAVR